MKKPFFFALIIMSFLPLSAQKTELLYLSGTDKDHTLKWDFFCTNGRNSGKWDTIGVPSNWELQGFGSYLYGKTNIANEKGLYKYEFAVAKNWKKKKVYIVFEGSMTDTEVKINGKSAGPVHQGAFYRFKYDISELLNYNGKNLLEVTVSKESSNESVNRAERLADYWVFGGIFRPVYLEAVPLEFIDRIAIDARADGTFLMDVFTKGKGKAETVKAQVQTPDGKSFGPAMSTTIEDGGDKTTIKGMATNPNLWNPEFPNMYQVVVSLMKGKETVHQIVQKFGFRTVEVRAGDGIYVNDRKIMFRGVCRHTFWPSSGRTSSKDLAIEDVNLMKDMNMNAVRMSHYPPDQYFLDVCDSLGMFVLDELGGWQKFYDTPTAKRLVKQLVERDVNHPSVILWDNGNEGGFNKDVRGDYSLYDPQKRVVIEPYSIINGTNTKHYPKYDYVENALNNGKEIFFPTEFLHGLFDGGNGAGLDDQWNMMLSSKLSAGAFLWVFADEGVERRDLNDSIDTSGNLAPDGILGPYHQKEGSYYSVKEIWSPVHFREKVINSDFNGKLELENRFIYSNLNLCKYSFELIRFGKVFPEPELKKQSGVIQSPDIPAGQRGQLILNLPSDWNTYDALYITANDQYGRQINTWSWNISKPLDFVTELVVTSQDSVYATVKDSLLIVSSGNTSVTFSTKSGLIAGVRKNSNSVSLTGGLRFAGFTGDFKEMKHYYSGNKYVIELLYNNDCHAVWTMLPGGWLRLDYDYRPDGLLDYAGITFSYPEDLVTGAKLLANGPFHVWKNRLKGTQFGLFNKPYNNTITGQTWDYPEFKGYYSNFYAVEVQTRELPITVVTATDGLFLHLFTPEPAVYSKGVRGTVNPPFPSGNISFLHGISAIGTKFSTAEDEGPQGMKNIYDADNDPLKGTLYFRFGE
ncbi:MAG: glycoside hydrolase family 2 TIM barrel-domain containing protein [Bacteroidales bacterium]